jgi:hypothetical protein
MPSEEGEQMTTTQQTKKYWLDVFAGWVEAREMPGPQNGEALQVISDLKAQAERIAEFEAGEILIAGKRP